MKHRINPLIDCVFKALFGKVENCDLLINFLNAVLNPFVPIINVDILNPYNERETLSDKLSIVDIKAIDRNGYAYQVEVQIIVYDDLPNRMLYTWSKMYTQQLQKGQTYLDLKPVHSIWLIAGQFIEDKTTNPTYNRCFKVRDDEGTTLNEHGGIWTLELKKFKDKNIENDLQHWLKFFKEGKNFNDENNLPNWMQTKEMKKAMNVLIDFSDTKENYQRYQSRENVQREERTREADRIRYIQRFMQERIAKQKERAAKEKERAAKEKERAAKEKALQREKKLIDILKKAGIKYKI